MHRRRFSMCTASPALWNAWGAFSCKVDFFNGLAIIMHSAKSHFNYQFGFFAITQHMKKKKWNVTWEHFSTLSSTPSHLFAMLRCCVVMSSPNRLSIIPALQRESSRTLWAGRETRSSWGRDSAREVWECRKYRRWRATDGVANGRYMSDDDSAIGTYFEKWKTNFWNQEQKQSKSGNIVEKQISAMHYIWIPTSTRTHRFSPPTGIVCRAGGPSM